MERKRPQQKSDDNEIAKRKRTKSDDDGSTPVRLVGTINKIILKNFMCHSLLEVTFEKNISYISGQNGSGKSAILTALVVGLGTEATVTNRGSSIKDFIRTGQKSVSVQISLNNRGPDAYEPSVYGGQITIVRNFTAAGRSSCKIKSASGAIISTRASDIHCITTHMNIQVDNPICILSQDTARTFLTTNDPKQKFILFSRATKLETLYEENRNIRESKEKLLRIYEEKEKVHNDLQIKLASLAKKMDNHKLTISLVDKRMVLQRELIWAKVKDEEKVMSEKKKVVEKLRQTCAKILGNCQYRVQRLEEVKQRVGELQQQILQLKEAVEARNVHQMDTQKCLEGLRRQLAEKRREKQRDLQKELSGKVQENLNKNEQQKFKKLKLARRKLDDLKSTDEPESTNVNSVETELNDLVQRNVDAEKVERELDEIKGKIVETDERLNNLIHANQSFEGRIVPLEQQVIEEINKKKELNIEDNFEKKRLGDIKKQLEPLESELIQTEKNLNDLMCKANKLGERLVETREVAEVTEELTTLNTTLAKIQADTGSLRQITRKYANTRQTINATREVIYDLYADIKELEYGLERRCRDYERTEEFFTNFLNHNFVQILGSGQFEGEVKVDMKEKTLDLVVTPQQGSNLSDGERSYATVSFLSALWQCFDFPFYFLDEFDAFMDSANRAKMMEVLIHHAKKHPEFQFVFLTKQDVSLVHNDDVALTKLRDPKERIEPQ